MARLRNKSLKRAKLDRVADKWRKAQIKAVGRCEWCLKKRKPEQLTVHEIGLGRGGNRWLAQDKAYSTLVLCVRKCHGIVQDKAEAVELAVLQLARPLEYNLAAHLLLTRAGAPQRIEQREVDIEVAKLKETGNVS